MRLSKCVQALLFLLPLSLIAGCGSSAGAGAQTGDIFTVATDAPLPSVVSCQIQVDGVSLNGSPNLLSTPELVDFAQLSGLHQLLDLTGVQTGAYTSATITLDAVAPPVIRYINTSVNPPAITMLTGASFRSPVPSRLLPALSLASAWSSILPSRWPPAPASSPA
jgi:hypothetical protein